MLDLERLSLLSSREIRQVFFAQGIGWTVTSALARWHLVPDSFQALDLLHKFPADMIDDKGGTSPKALRVIVYEIDTCSAVLEITQASTNAIRLRRKQ